MKDFGIYYNEKLINVFRSERDAIKEAKRMGQDPNCDKAQIKIREPGKHYPYENRTY